MRERETGQPAGLGLAKPLTFGPLAGGAALYALAWIALELLSSALLFWPAALRLAVLWWRPRREWPWIILADCVAGAVMRHGVFGRPFDDWRIILLTIAPVLFYAFAVAWFRGAEQDPALDKPSSVVRFLGAGYLAAVLTSPVLALYLQHIGVADASQAGAYLSYVYGDVVGILALGPLLLLMICGRWRSMGLRALIEAGIALGFSGLVFALLQAQPALVDQLLIVALIAPAVIAFRHGWGGAALALGLLGLALRLSKNTGLELPVVHVQAELAMLGSGVLLLGAALDQMRQHAMSLGRQHDELVTAHDANRALAQRLAALEDAGQQEVAAVLEADVAPPLEQARSQLGLAWREARDEQSARTLEALRGVVWQAQDALERALRLLRPPRLALDDLATTLGHGPLWDLAREREVRWLARVEGAAERLPASCRADLYRMAQAALRHALGSPHTEAIFLHVSAVQDGQGALTSAELRIDIQQPGRDGPPPRLQAIADRAAIRGGEYVVEAKPGSYQHRVRFSADALRD